jgi:site-specific DNA-methyltransferase (adenine-specific)
MGFSGGTDAGPCEALPSALGRWPANLIHDGSEQVVRLFPEDAGAAAARFFYCAKASKEDRDEGLEHLPERAAHELTKRKEESAGAENPRAGMTGARRNIHPTVKPTDLMRYLCRLVTPPGGLVLDPFMGSGSTGKAAILEGFRFTGIDMTPDYVEIARARIAEAAARPLQGSLFAA